MQVLRKCLMIIVAFLSLIFSGCASSPYRNARYHDFLDIFTATVGTGMGAKAAAGPFHFGLFRNEDQIGLRGGQIRSAWSLDEWEILSFGYAELETRTCEDGMAVYLSPLFTYYGIWTACRKGQGAQTIPQEQQDISADPKENANQIYYPPPIPHYKPARTGRNLYGCFTQIEVALGIGHTIRLGVNPGEFLDFLLGGVGVDLYGDDEYPDGYKIKFELER